MVDPAFALGLIRRIEITGTDMAYRVTPGTEQDDIVAQLRDFLHDCVSSAPAEEGDRLREAGFLLAGMDAERNREMPARVEALLQSGGGESAALALIGRDSPFMVSRGPNGRCLASLFGSDAAEEIVAEGATVALALLAAFASAMVSRIESDTFGGPFGEGIARASVRLH